MKCLALNSHLHNTCAHFGRVETYDCYLDNRGWFIMFKPTLLVENVVSNETTCLHHVLLNAHIYMHVCPHVYCIDSHELSITSH